MELNRWCKSGIEVTGEIKSRPYDRIVSLKDLDSSGDFLTDKFMAKWRFLWRKITKRDKNKNKKLMQCCSSRMGFSYDYCDYSKNFDDQGSISSDSDHFSRSFSARFAVPSRIFDDTECI